MHAQTLVVWRSRGDGSCSQAAGTAAACPFGELPGLPSRCLSQVFPMRQAGEDRVKEDPGPAGLCVSL